MQQFSTVGVIGAGSWGTVVANLIANKGLPVLLWAHEQEVAKAINREHRNPRYHPDLALAEDLAATPDLAELDRVDGPLFLAVPSKYLPAMREDLLNLLYGKRWISLIKGLVEGRTTVTLYLARAGVEKGVLAGPNLSVEIARGEPAAAVVASESQELAREVQELFAGTNLRVYRSTDVIGVEIGGVVKNVIAIAAGVLAGLGYGYNARAALLTRGMAELMRFAERVGAEPRTIMGLSGLGDLIATASTPLSRNFRVGERLAKGESLSSITASMDQVAEGVEAARLVAEWAEGLGVEMPICQAVNRVLHQGADIRETIRELMSRPLKEEFY